MSCPSIVHPNGCPIGHRTPDTFSCYCPCHDDIDICRACGREYDTSAAHDCAADDAIDLIDATIDEQVSA
jgi:hypothetical protein